MARPTQPKGMKPKADASPADAAKPVTGAPSSIGGGGSLDGIKIIIVNAVSTILISSLFIAGNFFIVKSMIDPINAKLNGAAAEEGGDEPADVEEPGLILDLGEFILNLSDPGSKRYLKVNVAIEVSKTEEEKEHLAKGESGGGGHGAKGPSPIELMIQEDMDQYKAQIRDTVISILSSKTAEELSSTAGKDLAKEQIKESIDAVYNGKRETMRVSFGTFIIQ